MCFIRQLFEKPSETVHKVLEKPGEEVYIAFDLDVLDSSLLSATGLPEPGGILWRGATFVLEAVFRDRRAVGCFVVGLSPRRWDAVSCIAAAGLADEMMATKQFFPR